MLKLKTPIPYGNDALDTPYPVKFSGDLRNKTMQLLLSLGIEEQDGICIGSDGGEFPILSAPFAIENTNNDPMLNEAFRALEGALEQFVAYIYAKLQDNPDLLARQFQVGRSSFSLDFAWKERDPLKHLSKIEKGADLRHNEGREKPAKKETAR